MQPGLLMLHQSKNFSKFMHLFRIMNIIFVCFYFGSAFAYRQILCKFEFMNIYLRILSTVAILTIACVTDLGAQTTQQESISQNRVISAVEKFNERDFDGAVSILKDVLASDEDCDAASYYLALSYIGKNNPELAEVYLKKAVESDPGNFWYRYRLAGLYAVTSRPELTVAMYEELIKDFPRRSDLYFDMVEMYSSQEDYEKALATLDKVETIFGKTESTAMFRFNLLLRMNKNEQAYASLEEFNKEYSSPYVLSALADWQMSMYNDTTALAYYNEALDIAPDYAPAILGKAETLRMTRKYDGYFEELNHFVNVQDYVSDGKCSYLMAVIQRMDNNFLKTFSSQFDTVFTNLNAAHPQDSTVLRTTAVYYYSTGRNEQADSCFRSNVEFHKESVSVWGDYIEFLMYAGKWQELSDQGRKAFEAFPDKPDFLEMASVGDYNLKEYDKVLEVCHKVLEVAPRDSSATLRAWSTAGDIYHQLGDSKKAYKAYERALKINPDYVYVLNNYAYYLSQEGKQLKKAYAMSKKTIEAEPDNATYLDTFGWILYLQGKALEAKPFFKHAMLYGGKESVVVMDHYAEVLYALKEYDLAFVYWNLAQQKNAGEIPDLDEKINKRKQDVQK